MAVTLYTASTRSENQYVMYRAEGPLNWAYIWSVTMSILTSSDFKFNAHETCKCQSSGILGVYLGGMLVAESQASCSTHLSIESIA